MKTTKSSISITDLLGVIGGKPRVLGEKDRQVINVAPVHNSHSDSVTFCVDATEKGLDMIRASRAGIIICSADLKLSEGDYKGKTLILVPNPRKAFIKIMQKFFREQSFEPGISPTSVIEKGAEISSNVHIGPHCYIGRCKIGDGTIIHGNAYIYANTVIGRNVTLQAGAVIGAVGVGVKRNPEGEVERFPQIGGVIIEDGVIIGSNTSIMRGTMGNTVVCRSTTIAHLCSIGHDVTIGRHCLVSSRVVIGGACKIGDYTQVSVGACIRPKIDIGRHVLVGMGAVVTRNVPDGKTVIGVPAKERAEG